jgi:hypothetical protein
MVSVLFAEGRHTSHEEKQMTTTLDTKYEDAVGELREQGLKVSVHSALNETWYIKGDGIYIGYVASGDELLELKRTHKLNLDGIKSLG